MKTLKHTVLSILALFLIEGTVCAQFSVEWRFTHEAWLHESVFNISNASMLDSQSYLGIFFDRSSQSKSHDSIDIMFNNYSVYKRLHPRLEQDSQSNMDSVDLLISNFYDGSILYPNASVDVSTNDMDKNDTSITIRQKISYPYQFSVTKLNLDYLTYNDDINLSINNSKIKHIRLSDARNLTIDARTSIIGSLAILDLIPHSYISLKCKVQFLFLERILISKIGSGFFVDFNGLFLDTLLLGNIPFEDKARLDLSDIKPLNHKILLGISSLSTYQNLKFNYTNFKILWNNGAKENRIPIYNMLLEKFSEEGDIDSYDSLDVEYKEYLYTKDSTLLGEFKNWIDKNWWYYGYEKHRVATNSLKIFGAALIVNLLYFPFLFAVYLPENFKRLFARLSRSNAERPKWRHLYLLQYIPGIIAYTTFIFWGIKLEISQLKFEKWWWPIPFSIILIEYVSGIICLAYLVNLIVTKV